MIRLLYISTARAEMGEAEITALLNRSKLRNASCQITGLLVLGGRRFLQVLEGPEDAVMETYHRIAQDPRHFAHVVLSQKTVTERLFPGWAMGYQKGGRVDERGGDAGEILGLMVEPIADPTVRAYFEQFVIKHLAA